MKFFVADGKNFIDQQDVRIDVNGDRESSRIYMPAE